MLWVRSAANKFKLNLKDQDYQVGIISRRGTQNGLAKMSNLDINFNSNDDNLLLNDIKSNKIILNHDHHEMSKHFEQASKKKVQNQDLLMLNYCNHFKHKFTFQWILNFKLWSINFLLKNKIFPWFPWFAIEQQKW